MEEQDTKQKATCWSVTVNNPTPADAICIAAAKQRGWQITGQLEQGANGTPHYQMMVRTPQTRFSAMKKQFPRAHIEVAKAPSALSKYVIKPDTRVGELPSSEYYPSLTQLWRLIYDQNNTGEKDGWDLCYLPNYVCFYDRDEQHALESNPLHWFDDQCRRLIRYGYHVETHAVNPQVRSCWRLFYKEILIRAAIDSEKMSQSSIPDALQEVNVPTLQEEVDASPPPPDPAQPPPVPDESRDRERDAGSDTDDESVYEV